MGEVDGEVDRESKWRRAIEEVDAGSRGRI